MNASCVAVILVTIHKIPDIFSQVMSRIQTSSVALISAPHFLWTSAYMNVIWPSETGFHAPLNTTSRMESAARCFRPFVLTLAINDKLFGILASVGGGGEVGGMKVENTISAFEAIFFLWFRSAPDGMERG